MLPKKEMSHLRVIGEVQQTLFRMQWIICCTPCYGPDPVVGVKLHPYFIHQGFGSVYSLELLTTPHPHEEAHLSPSLCGGEHSSHPFAGFLVTSIP